jgi:hypothetical protein
MAQTTRAPERRLIWRSRPRVPVLTVMKLALLRRLPKTRIDDARSSEKGWLSNVVASEQRADLGQRPAHRRLAELVQQPVQGHAGDRSHAGDADRPGRPRPRTRALEADVWPAASVGDGPGIADLRAPVGRDDRRAPVPTLAVPAPGPPRLVQGAAGLGQDAGWDLPEERDVDGALP